MYESATKLIMPQGVVVRYTVNCMCVCLSVYCYIPAVTATQLQCDYNYIFYSYLFGDLQNKASFLSYGWFTCTDKAVAVLTECMVKSIRISQPCKRAEVTLDTITCTIFLPS